VRMLRIANSPFFGLAGEVTSISQACMVLGLNAVRNIAIAVGVGNCFNLDGPDADEQRRLRWLAVTRAVAAQALASRCGLNKETAFTGGILHDLGKMVMNSCFADAMLALHTYQEEHDCDDITAEQAIFGVDYREMGRILAEHWALPELIQQIIAARPEEEGGDPNTLVDIVILADAVSVADNPGSAEEWVTALPEGAVQRLGLEDDVLHAWLSDIETIPDTVELLI
jgi:HD-like signal output (HDOD) protein